MKEHKVYEANDKMISLIADNCDILQSLGRFGLNLGFGDKTVWEVCEEHHVDTFTFLAVVNYSVNGYLDPDASSRYSLPTLLHYLKSSHEYYINFQLPAIRVQLDTALDHNDSLAHLIMQLYDEYVREMCHHMRYEEKTVFPYVEGLLAGTVVNGYDIETFSKNHGHIDRRLKELKNIIIKYFPNNQYKNNQLIDALHTLYDTETWLEMHTQVEEKIFIPAIKYLEDKSKKDDVSTRISQMINSNPNAKDCLSEREKEVIICLVQGMINKEIADKLCISVNTVITHRKNIAKKLQIHSPAGLTIYAIANNLIDISLVKL